MNNCHFVDIDGTILKHVGSLTNILTGHDGEFPDRTYPMGLLLPGVVEKFNEWAFNGDCIVITTARPECMREFTKKQLEYHGLFYDQLVMGLPRGPRFVYNDVKPATEKHPELITAVAVPLKRNEGLVNVQD